MAFTSTTNLRLPQSMGHVQKATCSNRLDVYYFENKPLNYMVQWQITIIDHVCMYCIVILNGSDAA